MPLVAERGADVTTKELAAAAGVAEGTLFRVFPDKGCLVAEVAVQGLLTASQPRRTRDDLASVDPALPLVERLARLIEVGQNRMEEVMRWMLLLRQLHGRSGTTPGEEERAHELRSRLMAQQELNRAVVAEGLRAALAPDLDRLRVPLDVATALLEIAVAPRRPGPDLLSPPLPPDVLADTLVHGLVRPSAADVVADVVVDSLVHPTP